MRAARHFICAALLVLGQVAQATPPNVITNASYAEPTDRYDHGVLGDVIEWGALNIRVDMCIGCEARMVRDYLIRLPDTRVFEDVAPRIIDVGDAVQLVMVVESDLSKGARLALYDEGGLVAATPFIGQRNRWLAPVGAADFDGDGNVEVAYIDRPHLAKTLRVWRYKDGTLSEIASLPGLTNHRIGERDIGGGVRTCAGAPQMVMASADWARVMVVGLENGAFVARDAGPHRGRQSLNAALQCQ